MPLLSVVMEIWPRSDLRRDRWLTCATPVCLTKLNSSVIGEVKNVPSLSYTNQLRDFEAYAEQKGLTFDLGV